MLTDDRGFADPFFGRLVPDQRDQRGGNDEFDQEAHCLNEDGGSKVEDGREFGKRRGKSYRLWGYQLSGDSIKLFTLTNN